MGFLVLHEGNNCTQDVVGALNDLTSAVYNFTNTNRFVNDEARSMSLYWMQPGTVITLYDNPEGRRSDEWCKITVKTSGARVLIHSFERSYEDGDVKVEYHHVNGLDGKVSRLSLVTTATPPRLLIGRMVNNIEAAYGGFAAKYGTAYERSYCGSQYRLWRPEIAEIGDHFEVSLAFDHIRGGLLDDHAVVRMKLSADLTRANSTTEVLLAPSLWPFGSATERTFTVPELEIADYIRDVGSDFFNWLEARNERGGRLNFPNLMRDEIETIHRCMRNAL